MLRRNHSGGSSTSRSFAKTALLPTLRKTFQFSDEQCPWYIFFTEPLFLIPSVQTEIQESGTPAGAILFSKEPLFLIPLGSRTPVGPRLSPAVLFLALHCKEVAEFRQYRKRARRCSDFLRQHPDTVLAKVPKEMAPLGEMPNP